VSSLPVPNIQSAIVSVKDKSGNILGQGFLISPWNSFFQQSFQQAPSVRNVTLTGSPFSYQANENGTVILSNGTVSAINLIRGLITIPLSLVRPLIIPISIGDTVKVTYSVAPTFQFLGA
jgi:nucleoid-associated protein YgaU